MTSTACDDQFAVCTPEEEEAFRAMQARKDEELISKQCAQRAEDEAICALRDQMYAPFSDPNQLANRFYAAIKAGRIPGVVLRGGHE